MITQKKQTRPSRKITIMQEDIDRAVKKSSSHCMIADAMKRERPDWKSISVDIQTIRYTDKYGKRHIVLTPPAAQEGLVLFDQGDERLLPFSFKLPHAAQVLAKRKENGRRPSTKAKIKQGKGSRGPVVHGGKPPPMGPLASGAGNVRKGKIRRWGMARIGV